MACSWQPRPSGQSADREGSLNLAPRPILYDIVKRQRCKVLAWYRALHGNLIRANRYCCRRSSVHHRQDRSVMDISDKSAFRHQCKVPALLAEHNIAGSKAANVNKANYQTCAETQLCWVKSIHLRTLAQQSWALCTLEAGWPSKAGLYTLSKQGQLCWPNPIPLLQADQAICPAKLDQVL